VLLLLLLLLLMLLGLLLLLLVQGRLLLQSLLLLLVERRLLLLVLLQGLVVLLRRQLLRLLSSELVQLLLLLQMSMRVLLDGQSRRRGKHVRLGVVELLVLVEVVESGGVGDGIGLGKSSRKIRVVDAIAAHTAAAAGLTHLLALLLLLLGVVVTQSAVLSILDGLLGLSKKGNGLRIRDPKQISDGKRSANIYLVGALVIAIQSHVRNLLSVFGLVSFSHATHREASLGLVLELLDVFSYFLGELGISAAADLLVGHVGDLDALLDLSSVLPHNALNGALGNGKLSAELGKRAGVKAVGLSVGFLHVASHDGPLCEGRQIVTFGAFHARSGDSILVSGLVKLLLLAVHLHVLLVHVLLLLEVMGHSHWHLRVHLVNVHDKLTDDFLVFRRRSTILISGVAVIVKDIQTVK